MVDKVNCWDYKKCGRDVSGDCPAVEKNAGTLCWLVAGTMCGGKPQGTFVQKAGNCRVCDYYQYTHQEE
jgi:hypothetical protein